MDVRAGVPSVRTGRDPSGAQIMDPVAHSVSDALKLIGISRIKFYALVWTGEIKVRKISKHSTILARDLDTGFRSLPTIGERNGQ